MNQNPNNKTGCLFPFGDDIFPFLMFLFHQDEQDSFGYDDDDDDDFSCDDTEDGYE